MHRRRLVALSSVCLLLPRIALASSPPELPEDDVQVVYENDMYVGRFSLAVAVPPALAWDVLTDFDHMSGFVPKLDASHILSRETDAVLVAQRGRLIFGPFFFPFESVRRVEMHSKERVLVSRAVSGNAKHMLSEMHLTPEKAGTRLDYRVEMIPDRWLPASLGIRFMRHELAEQFTALAQEMVRRQRRRP